MDNEDINKRKITESNEDRDVTTTVFAEDGTVAIKSYESNVDSDRLAIKDQSMSDFFAKPVLVSGINWKVTDAQDAILYSSNILPIVSANTMWANKLSGYGLFRGTAVFRVQLNASPMQQGKLLMYFFPVSTTSQNTMRALHTTFMGNRRMLPCIEIDAQESAAIIKIPYISPASWASLSAEYDWGTIKLCVLSPLKTGAGGQANADISIFLHFEDMEFAAATVPQSSTSKKKYSSKIITREQKNMEQGPITTALTATSKYATALGSIPMLAPITGPLSWATNAAAGVSAAFGWSKPSTMHGASLMSSQFGPQLATSDGVDTSYKLSLNVDHGVAISDGNSIRSEDEMSWAFLRGVETLIGGTDLSTAGISWSTTQAVGSNLFTRYVGPSEMFSINTKTYGPRLATFYVGPPIFYFSNYFTAWRGSICLRFKIVKTMFHTGRLLITFTPGTGALTPPNLSTSSYSMRTIIDLKDSNEACILIPWMLASNYQPTDETSGRLDIFVLNELRCPETVANTVQILVYASGGEDFELAIPGTQSAKTHGPCSPEMDRGTNDSLVEQGTIGNADESSFSSREMDISIGEAFLSLKQLLNRNNQVLMVTDPPITSFNLGFKIRPFYCSVLSCNATQVVQPRFFGDAFSYISPCFASYKGNARIGIMARQDYTNSDKYTASSSRFIAAWDPAANTAQPFLRFYDSGDVPYPGQPPGQDYLMRTLAGIGISCTNTHQGFCSWVVPYSSFYKYTLNTPTILNNQTGNEPSMPIGALAVTGDYPMFTTNAGTAANFSVYRSFEDGFHMSYFLGCPPLLALF